MAKFIKGQKGTLSTVFAVLLPLVLIVMALVLDGFRVFILKHELQSVCDSSALAGASAVNGRLIIDSYGNVQGDRIELDPVLADIYAAQLLGENISAHKFLGQGIKNVEILEKRAIDKNVDGTLDGYFIKLTAEIDSLIYGQVTGEGKQIKIYREAEAMMKKP